MWPHKKRNRRIFAWVSDTHAGKSTGLLNPDTVLIRVHDKGYEELYQPELSSTQRWLWPVFEEAIGELAEYAKDDEIVVAHAGDVTHGDRHGPLIPNTTIADQRTIAIYNMTPLLQLKNVTKVRFLTGTEVHVPDAAEVRVAGRLRKQTGLDIRASHHARFDMGKEWVDGSHHGPYPGSRDWLRGNVAFYHLKDCVYTDRRVGKEPAVVYLRGHYHRHVHVPLYDDWNGQDVMRHLIIIPAFSGLDGFTRKVGKSPPIIEAGIIALEFIDGHLTDIKAFKDKLDMRTEEKL